jgi:hypothetical protein
VKFRSFQVARPPSQCQMLQPLSIYATVSDRGVRVVPHYGGSHNGPTIALVSQFHSVSLTRYTHKVVDTLTVPSFISAPRHVPSAFSSSGAALVRLVACRAFRAEPYAGHRVRIGLSFRSRDGADGQLLRPDGAILQRRVGRWMGRQGHQ